MFTHGSHHEHQSHDSVEGDDQASSMLPALPDTVAQTIEARPTPCPHLADIPPANVVAPDAVDTAVVDAAGTVRYIHAPTPPASAPPQLDPLLAGLLDNEERHADVLDLLLALVKAREEEEEPHHRLMPSSAPDPIPQHAPTAQSDGHASLHRREER